MKIHYSFHSNSRSVQSLFCKESQYSNKIEDMLNFPTLIHIQASLDKFDRYQILLSLFYTYSVVWISLYCWTHNECNYSQRVRILKPTNTFKLANILFCRKVKRKCAKFNSVYIGFGWDKFCLFCL